MEVKDFFLALEGANSAKQVEELLNEFESAYSQYINWVPVGNRENNVGTIEVSADPGRAMIERITNGIDAILELEYSRHNGKPDCRSPREAASTWLNVPMNGLSDLTAGDRRKLAQKIIIRLLPGEGREARIVEIRDEGIGLTPEQMPVTILSLNESNKLQKYYVAGMYGQGGSSTLARSKYTLIASRNENNPIVGFTIVRYLDLPPESFKSGHYVFLTFNGSVLQTELQMEDFVPGTQVKHFGYDLSTYSGPVGPNSMYGLLNSVLFDPILPIWLDNQIHNYRRVIKGSRNALNGAIDEEDEVRRGPDLSHSMKMFFVDLGDWGRIGIEYWVLKKPEKDNRIPIKAFVDAQKPIVLTLNGQSHAEFSKILVSKNAELPYLTQRLIGHIDCNSLSAGAKRALFVSNREDARSGVVADVLQKEFVKALKSDDELVRLNEEARSVNLQERDQNSMEQMRKEVANILRVQGFDPTTAQGGSVIGGDTLAGTPSPRTFLKPIQKFIELREPPTFIKIIWDGNEEIPFYPGQRRYIRIETDANSNYHDPNNPANSKINIVNSSGFVNSCGSTPLQNGRMRIIYECNNKAIIGNKGIIRVELFRCGLSTLVTEKSFVIIDIPPANPKNKQLSLPKFVINAIDPEHTMWDTLNWPSDPLEIASSSIEEHGILSIYYSSIFPKFLEKRNMLERRDPNLAASFTKRYEVWLVVHSLLLNRDQQNINVLPKFSEMSISAETDPIEIYERKERCRLATIASIIAEREITSLETKPFED